MSCYRSLFRAVGVFACFTLVFIVGAGVCYADESKHVRILSIDGGGMHGLIPAHILAYIEKKSGEPISDLFDVVSGSSTGSIIAAGLVAPNDKGAPRYSAREVVESYEQLGKDVFQRPWWRPVVTVLGLFGSLYSGEGKTKILEEHLGDIGFDEARTMLVVPVYSVRNHEPMLLSSHTAGRNPELNFRLTDVVNGATAAPFYFPPVQVHTVEDKREDIFIDAGVYVNNPTMSAMLKAMQFYPGRSYMILSLGTGVKPASFQGVEALEFGILDWAKHIFQVILHGNAMHAVRETDSLFSSRECLLGRNYLRISPSFGNHELAIDDTSPEAYAHMKTMAEQAIRENKTTLDAFIEELKK